MCPKIENIEFVYNYFERIILNGNIILNYHNLNDLSIFPTDKKYSHFLKSDISDQHKRVLETTSMFS